MKTGEKSRKPICSFSSAGGDICIEPLCDLPQSEDFLSFRVVRKTGTNKRELCCLRASNIVQMRVFMASLGASGDGYFSNATIGMEAAITTEGSGDVCHKMGSTAFVFALPATSREIDSYLEALSCIPVGFYYGHLSAVQLPKSVVAERCPFPGSVLPPYSASSSSLPVMARRPMHDTFRPPNGRPVNYLHSLGCGREVDLPDGVQEMYNPCTQKSLFLDHNRLVITNGDLWRHKLECQPSECTTLYLSKTIASHSSDWCLASDIDTEESVIEEAAKRARSKTAVYTLMARGRDGEGERYASCGVSGAIGRTGDSGIEDMFSFKNSNGKNGENGGNGGRGFTGEKGAQGEKGPDLNITLAGSAEELRVTGSKEFTVDLGGCEKQGVLLIDNRGGKGGIGGEGGMGGVGGRGGGGGNGGCTMYNYGKGGDGGDGGKGGDGGDGGEGGDGGRGGNCLVQTSDPKLLILVEVDCLGGEPNEGSPGALGGLGGVSGPGGMGKKYYNPQTYQEIQINGKPGKMGPLGNSGSAGKRGTKGKGGGLLWMVLSPEGDEILERSHVRYDAEVLTCNVSPAVSGGVFEPNAPIIVSHMVIHNGGGLTLPHGTRVSIPSTSSILFEPSVYEVPRAGVKPKQDFLIPFNFHGRICDLPPPNSQGRQTTKAEFQMKIDVLGRALDHPPLKCEVTVQYPVQLGRLVCPENMTRGEVSTIFVEVANISELFYGRTAGGHSDIVLNIHLDARILLLGAVSSDSDFTPCIITYDPNVPDSMYVELPELPPKKTVTIEVAVQMESQAELFDRCLWQADLYLRGKLIEYNFQHIRVSAAYSPHGAPADLLLVTSEAILRKEFLLWQHIFALLETSVDFWDMTRHHGFSIDSRTGAPHANSWRGRYTGKAILYPHCDLELISEGDIVRHFHGEECCKDAPSDLGSSMVLFQSKSNSLSPLLPEVHTEAKDLGTICDSNGGNEDNYRCEEETLIHTKKELPSQSEVVCSSQADIRSHGHLMAPQVVPILRSRKFLTINDAITSMGVDDANLSVHSTAIPLASNFGQVFLVTLYALPIRAKLKLLKAKPSPGRPLFHLPNKLAMSCEELVMVSLAWEIAEELYAKSSSGGSFHTRELLRDIEANLDHYSHNGLTVLRGLQLIKEEANKRKANLKLKTPNVTKAHSEMLTQLGEIKSLLAKTQASGTNLKRLASLSLLFDHESILSHH